MNKKLFIDNWVNKIQTTGIKKFPQYFINEIDLNTYSVPIKTLIIGQEFFGKYEIITTEGDSIYQASDYDEAKFFVYSSRERNGKSYLPKEKSQTKVIVNLYHIYLDNFINQIRNDFKVCFPDEKDSHIVTTEILQKFNLIRY